MQVSISMLSSPALWRVPPRPRESWGRCWTFLWSTTLTGSSVTTGLLRDYHLKCPGRGIPKPEFTNPFQPYEVSTGEGESGWDLLARAALALQRVVSGSDRSVLVVAHGGIINAAMYCILGIPPPPGTSGVRFAIGDACFVRTSYDPDRHLWTVMEMAALNEETYSS